MYGVLNSSFDYLINLKASIEFLSAWNLAIIIHSYLTIWTDRIIRSAREIWLTIFYSVYRLIVTLVEHAGPIKDLF